MNGKINTQMKVGIEVMIGKNNQYAVSSMETENIFDIKETDTVDTIFHHIRHIVGFEY